METMANANHTTVLVVASMLLCSAVIHTAQSRELLQELVRSLFIGSRASTRTVVLVLPGLPWHVVTDFDAVNAVTGHVMTDPQPLTTNGSHDDGFDSHNR
jgi:hypothetical protein